MIGLSGKKLVFDGWNAQVLWEPRDLWIGVHWNRSGNCWDLYFCLVPCLPFHISWWYRDPGQ